jgi:hypothetical protein
MGYFGSRFVANDIQALCGNLFDNPLVKTFTLFCIMYQAIDNLQMSVTMTLVFLCVQYFASTLTVCSKKYIDKTHPENQSIVQNKAKVWPTVRRG